MRITSVAAASAAAITSILLCAAPAAAHVTVNPSTAPRGGYVEVSFRAPTESATASTTKLQVFFPKQHPIPSALVKPVPGWQAKVATGKPAKPLKSKDGKVDSVVTSITWTGGRIKPGQFQDFDVSLGPLPDAGKLVFKALQTYSDGSVVRWIDMRKDGAEEPAHPAPVLTLTAPSADPGTAQMTAEHTGASGDSASGGSDSLARDLAGVALLAGVVGIVLGAFGMRAARGRRE